MATQDELATDLLELFTVAEGIDAHGTFQPNGTVSEKGKAEGRVLTNKHRATEQDIAHHLNGAVAVGFYPLRADGTVVWGAIDIDTYPLDLPALARRVGELKLPLVVARSKSVGAHIYLFLSGPAPAAAAQRALALWAEQLRYPGVEIFPKQAGLSKDSEFGNFLFAPFFGAFNNGASEIGYAYGPDGGPLSLEQFIQYANALRVDPQVIIDTAKAEAEIDRLAAADAEDAEEDFDLAAWLKGTDHERNIWLWNGIVKLRGRGYEKAATLNLAQQAAKACTPAYPSSRDEEPVKKMVDRAYRLRGATTGGRPEIILWPGNLPADINRAEEVLIRNAERLKLFQRSDGITRVITLCPTDPNELLKHGLKRPYGAVQLEPVSIPALQEILDREISFKRPTLEGVKPIDCPSELANRYLRGRKGEWRLPALTGVIEAPILRDDGSRFSASGTYDPATGLYLYSGVDWSGIPDNPTREDAVAATRVLLEPFSEFPFKSEADKAVLASGILTALQRRLLSSAPLHGFTSPAPRHGKSLLAEAIGIIATGRKPPSTDVPTGVEELEKTITAILREGHLITLLDNMDFPLRSRRLCMAITQSVYSGRVLGFSEMLKLATNMLWLATGNNLGFTGDLTVRSLMSEIDSGLEHPEHRTFKIADLPAYLLEHRRELVAAALTVLRAYILAGRPRQGVKPWGGFDQWSAEIREALIWVGMADPVETRKNIDDSDPERERVVAVLAAWNAAFGTQGATTSELVAVLKKDEEDKYTELRDALLLVVADRNDHAQIDPRRLGQWFRTHKKRIYDGLQLQSVGDGDQKRWAVAPPTGVVDPATVF